MVDRFRNLAVVRRAARSAGHDEGQSLAEYGLILGLLAVACVVGLQTLGGAIANSAGFTSLPMSF